MHVIVVGESDNDHHDDWEDGEKHQASDRNEKQCFVIALLEDVLHCLFIACISADCLFVLKFLAITDLVIVKENEQQNESNRQERIEQNGEGIILVDRNHDIQNTTC